MESQVVTRQASRQATMWMCHCVRSPINMREPTRENGHEFHLRALVQPAYIVIVVPANHVEGINAKSLGKPA